MLLSSTFRTARVKILLEDIDVGGRYVPINREFQNLGDVS